MRGPRQEYSGSSGIHAGSKARCIRVAMIVTGFPDSDEPNIGNFNVRAVEGLRELVRISVIRLRAWKPGRRSIRLSYYNGIPIFTLAVPQVPGLFRVNIKAYMYFGWRLIRPVIQDCEIMHSVDGAFSGIVASAWAHWAKVRHIAQLVGGETTSVFSKPDVMRSFAGWETHLHGVACNSQRLAKEFLVYYPSVPNVQTVYRGVDLDAFKPHGSVAGPLADVGPVRYLFLGGFPPCPYMLHGANTKGGKTLLMAWQKAENELHRSGASLLIAGPKSEDSQVRRWRAGLNHPERVHLGGHIHPQLVASYIRSSDAVLVPSMEEGLPNVAMEAAACGRAVFGSNVGGIPEVVRSEATGLILPSGDVDAWRQALSNYAQQPNKLVEMGRRARQNVESGFNCKMYARQMFELYLTTLEAPITAS